MTRLLQLSARCHGDGAPYKAAAGVGLARRARTAPSQSLAGARRPRHGGRGLSPVLARAVSRPWRGGRRGRGGGGCAAATAKRGMGPHWPRARGHGSVRTPHPRFPLQRGEDRGAHTQRLLKAPREALDGIEDFDSRNLAMPPNPLFAHHPGLPAHLYAHSTRERKVPRFLCRGVVGEDGKVPRTELAGIFQTKHLVKSG